MVNQDSLTPHQEDPFAIRSKIYDVALDLFHRYGYDNVTIFHVCDKVGITVGQFSKLFKSKEEILDLFMEEEDQTVMSVLANCKEKSHLLRFKELCMLKIRLVIEKGSDIAIHCAISQLKTYDTKAYSYKCKLNNALLTEIQEGQKAGEIIQEMDPKVVVDNALLFISGLLNKWMLSKGTIDAEKKP